MNLHSAMRFLKKSPWLFEWFYAKLSLNGCSSAALKSAVSAPASSVQAEGFEWPVPASGFLHVRNSSGKREIVRYSSCSEENDVYTFALSSELENSYAIGDFCAVGTSLIEDWDIHLYTGTGWNDIYSAIPELEAPALIISLGNASYHSGDPRITSVDILVLASDTVLLDSPEMEAQRMLDKVLEILDWAPDGKLLCMARSHQAVDIDGINLCAYKVNFDLTENVRYR